MINMEIGDYRLTSDANQVIVNRVRRDENGEISMVTDKTKDKSKKDGKLVPSVSLVGYYVNLSKAFVGIQRDYVLSGRGVEITDVPSYLKALQDITREFEEKVNFGEEF